MSVKIESLEARTHFAVTPNTGFSGDGLVQSGLTATALESEAKFMSDGRLQVASLAKGASGSQAKDLWLTRYTSTGSMDSSLNGSGNKKLLSFDSVVAADFDASGRVIAAGWISGVFKVYRFTTAGVIDSTFGNGGSSTVPTGRSPSNLADTFGQVEIDSTGRVVVAVSQANEFDIVRFSAGGILDTKFADAGELRNPVDPSHIFSMITTADGSVFLGGRFNTASLDNALVMQLTPRGYLAKVPNNARRWAYALGTLGNDWGITELAQQSDGKLLMLMGDQTTYNVNAKANPAIVRLTINRTVDTGFGNQGVAYPDADFRNIVGMELLGDKILIAENARIGVSPNKFPGQWLLRYRTSDGQLDTTFDGDGREEFYSNLESQKSLLYFNNGLVVAGINGAGWMTGN